MIENAKSHGVLADVEMHPDPEAPIGHVDGFWRREARDVIVKVDDEPSDLEPLRWGSDGKPARRRQRGVGKRLETATGKLQAKFVAGWRDSH